MRLKEVTVSANTGLDAIKRAPIVDYDTGLKCIRIQDISQNKEFEDWGNTETTDSDYKKFKLKRNDLLIARTGATVGVSFIVKKDFNAVFNNGSIRLRFNEKVNPSFISYVFKTNSFRQYIDNVSCVATQPNLRVENLLRFTIPDYDMDIQNRIVHFLNYYDQAIENNTKRIKILEQMAENMYKEWFVRYRFPSHENVEFQEGIPQNWKYRRADEVIQFNPLVKVEGQEVFTIIPMEALSTTSMVLDTNSFILQDSITGKRSQNGDTLFAKITPCLENGKTGFVMGLKSGEVAGGSTEFIVLRSKKLNSYYVYCLARSYYFRQTAILSMNGADGRQRVSEDKLKSLKVIQPTEDILNRFENAVSPIFLLVNKLVLENRNLINQRDLLLPRLMSGKLQLK